jgi:hypothetical protein
MICIEGHASRPWLDLKVIDQLEATGRSSDLDAEVSWLPRRRAANRDWMTVLLVASRCNLLAHDQKLGSVWRFSRFKTDLGALSDNRVWRVSRQCSEAGLHRQP